MKYFQYIADGKVDMLLSQIDAQYKKAISVEFGVDLKLFKAKRTVERDVGANRIMRLKAVLEWLHKYGNIGSVDEPDEYIFGTLPMRCLSARPHFHPEIMYLCGRTKKSVLGLGGSAANVIGALPPAAEQWQSNSNTYALLQYLNCYLKEGDFPQLDPKDALWPVINLEIEGPKTPYENFEFLAKRLVVNRQSVAGQTKKWNVILATPALPCQS